MFEDLKLSNVEKNLCKKISHYEKNDLILNKTIVEKTIGIINDSNIDRINVILEHVLKNKKIIKNPRIHFGSPFICLKDYDIDSIIKTNLIVTSDKLIDQWAKKLKYMKADFHLVKNKNDILIKHNFLFVLCNESTYKILYENYKIIRWNRIILDNSENLNINSPISWNCNFVWLISCEPDRLFYSNKEYLKPISKINDYQLFRQLIINSKVTNVLNIISHDIICCDTIKNDEIENFVNLLKNSHLDKIKLLCNVTNYNYSKECVICYDKHTNFIRPSCCKQVHCSECFIKILGSTTKCSCCRSEIDVNLLQVNLQDTKTKSEHVTKETWLNNFIKDNYKTVFIHSSQYWYNFFKNNFNDIGYVSSRIKNIHSQLQFDNILLEISDDFIYNDLNKFCNVVWIEDCLQKQEKNVYNMFNTDKEIYSYKLKI
jgi:hypothetical protein